MLIRTVECIDSCTAPCPGPRAWRRLRRSLRPTRSLMRRNGSGATGCRGRGSPITRCRSATAPASAVAS
jgi:hypothetical protein